MENSVKRSRAHGVAMACLVLDSWISAKLILSLAMGLSNWEETEVELSTLIPDTEDSKDLIRFIFVFGYALDIIYFLVKVGAAYFLLKATREKTEISVDLKLKYCKTWKIVTTMYLLVGIFAIFAYGLTVHGAFMAVLCIKDSVFLYIVGLYTDELRTPQQDNTCSDV